MENFTNFQIVKLIVMCLIGQFLGIFIVFSFVEKNIIKIIIFSTLAAILIIKSNSFI